MENQLENSPAVGTTTSGIVPAASVKKNAPKTVLLFRHAEKPTDATDVNLSTAGQDRAEKLAEYIPTNFGKPDFIFATANSKHSERPYQTVLPLSNATGVTIDATIANGDFADLATLLFSDAKYSGMLVVVCWHHGKIPDLAAALNAPTGTYPSPWDEAVFDLILRLDYAAGTHVPTVKQITEPF